MHAPAGLVRITLASIVLDRPDHSGRYIAKDLAGGWAYLVADGDGDSRYRGQGVCEGGLEVALRCSFLSAMSRVPECRRIVILVQDRDAHRAMVRLACEDMRVAAAIAGRMASVMTRPEERASFHVRSAAERVAAATLMDRERAELAAPLPPEEVEAGPTPERGWRRRAAALLPASGTDRAGRAGWLADFDSHLASASSGLRAIGG